MILCSFHEIFRYGVHSDNAPVELNSSVQNVVDVGGNVEAEKLIVRLFDCTTKVEGSVS
jgi:hypothetical protein